MNKVLFNLMILISFLLISCTDEPVKDMCTVENCSESYKECKEDKCVLKENACETSSDCEDKICDNHKCVEEDLCKDIVCDSWKECNSNNGSCELKTNMCDKNGDCTGEDIYCEAVTHKCKLKDPCDGISCSNHGFCAVTNENKAICSCETDYHPEELKCIKDTPSLCDGISCSNHGDCVVLDNRITCNCDTSYHPQDLNCIKDSNPCEDISCSGYGICAIVNGNEAICSCQNGYHTNPLNALECIVDVVDLCANANCDEWRECNSENGICELKIGRCETTDNCSGENACNDQHICENLCTDVNCSNHGNCSVENSIAICSCEDNYRVTDDKKFCLWDGYQWTNTIDNKYVSDITLDNDGDIYILGKFEGRVNFDSTGGTDYKIAQNDDNNIYLTKYKKDGSYEWTKVLFINYDNYQSVYSVLVDNQKNIYISYSNYYSVIGAEGSYDHFKIAKLSSSGNQIWEKNIDSDMYIEKMIFDESQENIILAGSFSKTFELNSITYESISASSYSDVIVLKYDINGTNKWIKIVGSGYWNSTYVNDITINSNEIYLAGSIDYTKGFIAKLSIDSTLLWRKSFETGESEIQSIEVNNNNIYALGKFKESVDFNFGDTEDIMTSNGDDDIFILKLTKNGSFVWGKTYGGTGSDIGYELAINENSLYLAGVFSNTISFDSNVGAHSSNGEEDIFLLTLDFNGTYLDSQFFGGVGEEYIYNMIYNNNSIYLSGFFEESVDFDPSIWNVNISSQGTKDIFTWKYLPQF